MKTRIITAVVALLISIPFFVYSYTLAFPLIIAFASTVGVFEMLRCLGEKNPFVYALSCVIAAAMPICARLYGDEKAFFNFAHKVCITYLFFMLLLALFSKGKRDVSNSAMIYVMNFLIINGFSSIILLRDYEYGQYIYMFVFICPWATDIFAYFTGWLIGKHKLIPEVSPKKTVEGAIGGIVFCTLFFVAYGLIVSNAVEGLNANYPAFVVIGIVLSVVSQCGDLIFSLIKRKYGLKDYGKIMPGHGGILDRFDSVIAAAPLVLLMFDLSGIFRLFR